jgi:chemotaxis protein MotB
MNTTRATLACLAAVASLTFSGCGCDRELAYKDVQIQELERVNKELEALLAAKDAKMVREVIASAPANQPSRITDQQAAGADVNVSDRNREIVFSIESSILFKAGSAELSPAAKSSINKVVAIIKEKYPNHYVRVEGHTDDQKISRTKDKWDDNWDLSGGRAQKVLHYLLERGIKESDLGFAGYAYVRPVSPGSAESSRMHNRRVEIVAIPKH